ncbi:MAG: hypothetical protein RsTaC01_1028 [Candidatus Paraimprobicoccus trichonymphae]|uniref:Uncharacterized protein n=1 Tax=Candidatus Paraimprobicoccus trichonymphae TaxID=3033793 RepID=A0AA48KZN7_9FIRM|nr:MAG: hypothetical protein RsTaC01_1028 [Candidatus Paraimprobicoccus trichonymphae]
MNFLSKFIKSDNIRKSDLAEKAAKLLDVLEKENNETIKLTDLNESNDGKNNILKVLFGKKNGIKDKSKDERGVMEILAKAESSFSLFKSNFRKMAERIRDRYDVMKLETTYGSLKYLLYEYDKCNNLDLISDESEINKNLKCIRDIQTEINEKIETIKKLCNTKFATSIISPTVNYSKSSENPKKANHFNKHHIIGDTENLILQLEVMLNNIDSKGYMHYNQKFDKSKLEPETIAKVIKLKNEIKEKLKKIKSKINTTAESIKTKQNLKENNVSAIPGEDKKIANNSVIKKYGQGVQKFLLYAKTQCKEYIRGKGIEEEQMHTEKKKMYLEDLERFSNVNPKNKSLNEYKLRKNDENKPENLQKMRFAKFVINLNFEI